MSPPSFDIESQYGEKVPGVAEQKQDARHFKPAARFPAEYRTLSIHVDDPSSTVKDKQGEKRKVAVKGLITILLSNIHNRLTVSWFRAEFPRLA